MTARPGNDSEEVFVNMRLTATGVLAMIALVALGGVAEARNPHCAGGIQYFSQAMADKQKGNTEDYQREIGKAVAQLTQCSGEDPNDLEAMGYLGMAYAEMDSAGPAGEAFEKAIAGMKAKGDKKLDWVTTNRQSYWAGKFNDGIAKINAGQALASSEDKAAKEQAQKSYDAAVASLTRALQLKPNDPQTMGNLAVAYALMGQMAKAKETLEAGLKANPGDPGLQERYDQVKKQMVSEVVNSGNFDAAIATLTDALKKNDKDSDAWTSLGDTYFKRAQGAKEEEKKKADYKASGAAYAKAASLKDSDPDLSFNAAVAYSNAGMAKEAEPLWRATVAKKPEDPEALSGFAGTLAELGKYSEAASVLKQALSKKPDELTYHRQLVGVYAKANDTKLATGETFVVMAMTKGKELPTVSAPAGSAEAQTVSSEGTPEKIYQWEADGQKYETLMYFKKARGFHFHQGQLVAKSDWASAGAK